MDTASLKQELLKHLQTIQTLRQSLSRNDEVRNMLKKELAIVTELVSILVGVYNTQISELRKQPENQEKVEQLTRESGDLVMMLSSVTKSSEGYLIKDMFTPPADPSQQIQQLDTDKILIELKSDPKTKKAAESIETIVAKMHVDYASFLANEKNLETRSKELKEEMDKIAHLLADNQEDKQIIAHMFDLMNQSIKVQCEHAVYVHDLKKQVMKIVSDLRKEGQKLGRTSNDKKILTQLYDKMDDEKRVTCEMKITQALYQETIANEMNDVSKLTDIDGLSDEQRVKLQKLVDAMHQSKLMYQKEGFEMTKKGWTWLIVGYVLFLVVLYMGYKFLLGGRI